MLSSMVRGSLNDPDLGTTTYFQNLDPSERRVMSFLLAQAFTCWFAQRHLGAYVLVHVRGANGHWTASPLTLKPKGGGDAKANSEPDFIAIGPNEFHVFESKGRSLPAGSQTNPKNLYTACRKDALAQASRINSVLGKPPKTSNVAVWVFMEDGPRGYVEDPSPPTEALDLKFDLPLAFRQAYRIFTEATDKPTIPLMPGFEGFRIAPDRVIGIDSSLWRLLRTTDSDEKILDHLERNGSRYALLNGGEASVGL